MHFIYHETVFEPLENSLSKYGILYHYTSMSSRKAKIESTPLYSTFKLTKYRGNEKLKPNKK